MKELLSYFILVSILFFGVRANAFTVVSPPQDIVVSAIVLTPGGGGPDPISGGGGTIGGYLVPTSVNFSGFAYSFPIVSLLKDGQFVATTAVSPDSKFLISLNSGLNTGNYLFSIYGEDSLKRRSKLFNFSLHLVAGTATNVSGIIISPEPESLNVFTKDRSCFLIADLNNDCKVSLVDFSIMSYWYKKQNPPARVDLSKDKKIDITDFSILAYYWTG